MFAGIRSENLNKIGIIFVLKFGLGPTFLAVCMTNFCWVEKFLEPFENRAYLHLFCAVNWEVGMGNIDGHSFEWS